MGASTSQGSAFFFLVVSIMAAVVIAPLSIVAWLLRQKIDSDVNKEKPRVLEQAIGFFQTIKAQ